MVGLKLQRFLWKKGSMFLKKWLQTIMKENNIKSLRNIELQQTKEGWLCIEHCTILKYLNENLLNSKKLSHLNISNDIFVKKVNNKILVECIEKDTKDKYLWKYIDPIEE